MKLLFLVVGFILGCGVTFFNRKKAFNDLKESQEKEKSQLESQVKNEMLEQLEGNLIQLTPFLDNVTFVQFSNGKYSFFDEEENPISKTKNTLEKIKSQEKIVDGEVYVKDMVFKVTHNEEEVPIQSYVPESLSFDSSKSAFVERRNLTGEDNDSANMLCSFVSDLHNYNYTVKREPKELMDRKLFHKKENYNFPYVAESSIPMDFRIEQFMVELPDKINTVNLMFPSFLFSADYGVYVEVATEQKTSFFCFNSKDTQRTKFLDNIFSTVKLDISPTSILGIKVYSNTQHTIRFFPDVAALITVNERGEVDWVCY